MYFSLPLSGKTCFQFPRYIQWFYAKIQSSRHPDQIYHTIHALRSEITKCSNFSNYCTQIFKFWHFPLKLITCCIHSKVKSNCSNLFLKSSACVSSSCRFGLQAFQSTRSGMSRSWTLAITSLSNKQKYQQKYSHL